MINRNYSKPTLKNIASLENLYMAWHRIEKSIKYSDVWYDEYEFCKFKFQLDKNIRQIQDEILSGNYIPDEIRPIPFPKGGKTDEGKLKVRQAFTISMRDQLVWVAVCNIIGPIIEDKMPAWSTGNRLYVPIWKENDDKSPAFGKWQFGGFMNSYPFIFRKWNQSWPRYRKVLTASIKKMAIGQSNSQNNLDILDDIDETEINDNETLPDWLKIDYLKKGYFKDKEFKKKLFWGSIDLKTFYPKIDTVRLENILINHGNIEDVEARNLIHELLQFHLDTTGFSEVDLEELEIDINKQLGLPTGLIVGGWLANVYLLPIDMQVKEHLKTDHKIIHFRYVDDHTFVADNFRTLIDWMHWYYTLLKGYRLEINFGKLQPSLPPDLADLYEELVMYGYDYIKSEMALSKSKKKSFKELEDDVLQSYLIDPIYPSPLMTLTLQKVSQISHFNLNLLSKNETEMIFHDLKSLVTIDLPEAEIKKDTRISFASTMLSRMMMNADIDLDLIQSEREKFLNSCREEFNKTKSELERLKKKDEALLSEQEKEQIKELELRLEEIDKCRLKAFGDFNIENKDPLKINFPELFWDSIDNAKRVVNESSKHCKRKANKVFYLLLKAIDESPEKTNIWIRTLEFCIKHCPENILIIFDKLNHVQLNSLGKLFLRRQLVALCAKRSYNAIWRKYEDKADDIEESFIEIVLKNIKPIDSDYYFVKGTNDLLAFAKCLYVFLIYGDIEPIGNFFRSQNELMVNFYLIYILESAGEKIAVNDQKGLVDSLSIFAKSSEDFIYSLLICILDIKNKAKEKISDAWRTIFESKDSNLLVKSEGLITDKWNFEDPNEELSEYISIRDLIASEKWQLSRFSRSEYLACRIFVDILDNIITLVEENPEIYPSLRLDIANIFVSKDKVYNIDWHKILSDDYHFDIQLSDEKEPEILKRLYAPPEFIDNRIDTAIVHESGVIFYHLLNGSLEDNWKKLISETGYSWKSKIQSLCDSGKIGSSTKKLLEGCLLPNAWESLRVNGKVSKKLKERAIKNFTSLHEVSNKLLCELRNQVVLKSISAITKDIKGNLNNNPNIIDATEFKVITVD